MSGSPMSFSSMKGLNSYRSPNALRPIPLSSSNRAFSNWTKEQFGVDKKEAEFVSVTELEHMGIRVDCRASDERFFVLRYSSPQSPRAVGTREYESRNRKRVSKPLHYSTRKNM